MIAVDGSVGVPGSVDAVQSGNLIVEFGSRAVMAAMDLGLRRRRSEWQCGQRGGDECRCGVKEGWRTEPMRRPRWSLAVVLVDGVPLAGPVLVYDRRLRRLRHGCWLFITWIMRYVL
jgi:hypothetical protein